MTDIRTSISCFRIRALSNGLSEQRDLETSRGREALGQLESTCDSNEVRVAFSFMLNLVAY